jgi:hypothetical protein
MDAYFCGPQAPWQKGTVENTNGRLRRFLPLDADITDRSTADLRALAAQMNATPRKCLGFMTPTEAFAALLRSCALASPGSSPFGTLDRPAMVCSQLRGRVAIFTCPLQVQTARPRISAACRLAPRSPPAILPRPVKVSANGGHRHPRAKRTSANPLVSPRMAHLCLPGRVSSTAVSTPRGVAERGPTWATHEDRKAKI